MEKILNVFVSNRFKSFYWRTGMMVLAVFVTFLSENLADFSFSGQTTVVLGLILGEFSKYLNSKSK